MKKIRYLIMDVDGTLTDGKIYMGANGEAFKVFHVKDGYGIGKMLPELEVEPVIMTGRNSAIVENRCKELRIKYVFQNVNDKVNFLKKWLEEQDILANQVAYVGDDDNDLECIRYIKENGGLTGCPQDASDNVLKSVDYVGQKMGGDAFVREYIENVLKK